MTQLAAPSVASGASLATFLASYLKFGASTVAVVNAAVEGGAASNPNIAASTVDRTNMRSNASVGIYAAEAGQSAFVVTEAGVKGLQYVSASGFTATYSAGSAWVRQTSTSPDDTVRVTKSTTWTVLLTALSDNYVYIKSDASVGVSTASIGGTAPTLPVNSLLLSIATTDASTVSGTPVDMGPDSGLAAPKHYRSKGAWPYPTSTTVFTLPPGVFEVDGLTVVNTANQSLNIGTVTFLSGVRTSNVHTYFYVANNGGSPKYGLSTSAPSAATIVSGTTGGATGLKQYRGIGGLGYRCLGSCKTSTTGVFKLYWRDGRKVILENTPFAFSTVAAGSTYITATASSVAPATSRMIIASIKLDGQADPSDSFYRATSTTGAGRKLIYTAATEAATDIDIPLNSKRSFDYKVKQANDIIRVDIPGYYDTELD